MADSHVDPAVKLTTCPAASTPQRRGFLTAAMAIVIGAIVTVFPFVAGMFSFLDPLRRTSGGGKNVRVASLDAVPDDGLPHPFAISADVVDGWTTLPNEPIGRVYLIRKKGTKEVKALSATCPHLGCMVGYEAAQQIFRCPCHTSAFDINGKRRLDISTVPPRNMDSLTCTVDGSGEIWVDYLNFKTGLEQSVPRA